MSKLIRPEYRRMYEVMRVRLAQTLSKCVFIILIFNLVQSFFFSVGLSPVFAAEDGKPGFVPVLFSAGFSLLVFYISLMFFYGILSFFTKVILGRRDIMHVFTSAFRDRTGRAKKMAVFQTFLFAVSVATSAFIVWKFRDLIFSIDFVSDFVNDEQENYARFARTLVTAGIFCAVFFILSLCLSIPFLFVWNILYDDKKIRFSSALKKSAGLMIPNALHFIGFVIFTCLKNVAFIAVLCLLNMRISGSQGMLANILSMMLGFFAFVQEYTIIAKAYSSIPVYYYSLLSVNGMIEPQEKNESSSQ